METQQQLKDLSKLEHTLAYPPLHLYYERMKDGTRMLRHIRVNQRTYEVPTDGSGITIDVLPADSVGTREIRDKSIEMADLSEDARDQIIELNDVQTVGPDVVRKMVRDAIRETQP